MPFSISRSAHALRILRGHGDDADFDLVALADLAEPRQMHDGLAAVGGADEAYRWRRMRRRC